MSGKDRSLPGLPERNSSSTTRTMNASQSAVTLAAARSRALLFGILFPTLVAIGVGVVVTVWLPLLPNPVAVHWGIDGIPDGFGPPVVYPALVFVVTWLLPVGMTLLALFPRSVGYGVTTRFIVATSVWLSVFMGGILFGGVYVQRGLSSAAMANSILPAVLVSLLIASLVGLIAYRILPKTPRASKQLGTPVAPLPVETGTRVVWTSEVNASAWITVPVLGAFVVCLVFSVFTRAYYLLGIPALLILLIMMMGSFRVSAGQAGLRVRSRLGWPNLHVPLQDIQAATVVNVEPFQEWGGWGFRYRPGGVAVVMHSGPGLQVLRKDGRIVVVTVPDAALGAATLTALVDQC